MSRFQKALLLALALHGAAALWARFTGDRARVAALAPPSSELLVELDVADAADSEPSAPAEPAPPTAEPPPPPDPGSRDTAAVARQTARPDTTEPSRITDPPSDALAVESAPEDAPTADAAPTDPRSADATAQNQTPSRPSRRIDLGLDGRMFLLPPGAPGAATAPAEGPPGPRARKSEVQRRLEASLSADDVRRGLARGGALIGSLNSAVRAQGPVRGDALIRVTFDSQGQLGHVELLRGSDAEWSAALRAFMELGKRKRVRLPPGSQGLRVTFSVSAKVQRASGTAVEDLPVRVPGASLEPDGLIPKLHFDPADASGAVQRLVYARVVSEEIL